GPDFDFGAGPNLFTTANPVTGRPEQLLGAGQKSGVYWALDPATGAVAWQTIIGPAGNGGNGGIENGTATDGRRIYAAEGDTAGKPYTLGGSGPYAGQTATAGSWAALDPATGKILWQTQVGPAGNGGLGGIEYGAATDGRRIYAAEGDTAKIPYTLGGSGPYAGQTVTGGSWAALDPATGKILWQTPDPQGAVDASFVSTANGVVYAGSMAAAGTNMYALDAATGKILWSFASGGSVTGGAAIAGGSVYWGSGYCGTLCLGGTTPVLNNNKVYAFGLK
ncbi:MAG: hypothetical protein QOJ73_6889, partial [Streptosporangiaceae bacterium]|nr:hypothetical protein [Streptosporangiaceae bacterium]